MNFIDDAYERLSKTAPDLIRYISTFIDLTNEVPENYGVELGVFMLISGQSLFYVPVVAKGGTVYPIDSVFSAEDSQFFPLTPKFVDKVINSNEMNLGQKTSIPGNVIKNPNVRELIEPPKTGKFAYAGTGLSEFLYQLSEPSKKAILEKISADTSFGKGLHKLGFDLSEIKEVLTKPLEKKAEYRPVEIGIRIVTGGENLPDTVVQEILQRGYGVVGYNTNPTFAVEYDAKNDGYTKLSAAQEGQVYEVIMKDGSSKDGFVPPQSENLQETSDDFDKQHQNEPVKAGFVAGGVKVRANKTAAKTNHIIFEDGTYACGVCPVIRSTTLGKMDDIVLELGSRGLFRKSDELMTGFKTFMLITKNGWLGPLTITKPISHTEAGTTIFAQSWDYEPVIIHQSPNIHGDYSVVGRDVYVNNNAVFFEMGENVSGIVETDPSVASVKRSHMFTNLLAPVKIGYDGVEFSLNGRAVGGEADLARELIERKGLSKQAFDQFVKKAHESSSLMIYMSKEAAMGAGPDYQTLPPNLPGSQMTPAHDNSPAIPQAGKGYENPQNGYNPNFQTIQGAMSTGDKSIVESTIISEFINDPNMFETIGTYLPVIKEAVDKLGRSIFLVRLNINNLSSSIEPEYLSNLMSSLRNTYKMLGDTYMRLDSLTNTPLVEESEL